MARNLVDAGIKTPGLNETAIGILNQSNTPQYDQAAAARAVYEWVHRNIRYVEDPVNKETLRPADVILSVGAGDCDDINGILLPSLLGTIGVTSRLVTVAADPSQPDQFTHVYAEALLNGQWVPLDAARPDASYGVAPPYYFRRKDWNLFDGVPTVGRLAGGMMGMGFDWGADVYRENLRGLGDDTTSIFSTIPVVETGISQIIAAAEGHPVAPLITTGAGQLYPGYAGGTVASVKTNVSPWLVVGGLAIVAFLVFRK